jgi:folate-binding protein YgfZ
MATIISSPAAADGAAWTPPAALTVDARGEFAVGEARAEAAAALERAVMLPLRQLGTIRASGADAESFLQNQLSNDLRALGPARAQLASYNSPKGRVLALFTLFRSGGNIFLETRGEILATTLKRLRMYVLRSKLSLEDASQSLPALGLAGPEAARLLGAAGLPAPPADWDCASAGEALVLRRPGRLPRWSVHAPPAHLQAIWDALQGRAQPVGSAAWRLLDIRAGLPSIRPETADQFVAQMLNLDRLGAISFTKGCYPGQEIVARLHYLGNLKRRLFSGVSKDAEPLPGAPVFAAGAEQSCGTITDSAPAAAGGWEMLAVLPLGLDPGTELRLGSAAGAELNFDLTADVRYSV